MKCLSAYPIGGLGESLLFLMAACRLLGPGSFCSRSSAPLLTDGYLEIYSNLSYILPVQKHVSSYADAFPQNKKQPFNERTISLSRELSLP